MLLDPFKGVRTFFSLELTDVRRVLLGEQHKAQLMFEAGTLAAVVAFLL